MNDESSIQDDIPRTAFQCSPMSDRQEDDCAADFDGESTNRDRCYGKARRTLIAVVLLIAMAGAEASRTEVQLWMSQFACRLFPPSKHERFQTLALYNHSTWTWLTSDYVPRFLEDGANQEGKEDNKENNNKDQQGQNQDHQENNGNGNDKEGQENQQQDQQQNNKDENQQEQNRQEGKDQNQQEEQAQEEEEKKEEEKDEEEEEAEEEEKEEEEAQNDGENNNGKEKKNKRPGGDDDYFDDRIQEKLADDYYNHGIDDFYAMPQDPQPPRLFPMSDQEQVGYVVAALAMALGASGGTGGGGIIVPIYALVVGLPLKAAIPVSAVTVLGGAIASTLLNLGRRHPLADRPIIDWDLVLSLEPLTLVGTLMGTVLHRLLSEKLLVVLLVLLLSITAHSTLTKAMRMYQAEKRYLRLLKASNYDPNGGSPQGIPKSYTWGQVEASVTASTGKALNENDRRSRRYTSAEEKQEILILNPDYVTLRSDMVEEEKFTPGSKIMALICMFTVVIFLNIMAGGGAYESPWEIVCGSTAFWVVHVVMVAFLIASAWAAQTYLVARHEKKRIVRFDYVHGDIKWDTRKAIIYPAVFICAGLFAGALGIGGGIVTVPIMLVMGVHPAVVTATSSAMMLFTSTASTSSFLVFGLILKDYAIAGFATGFFSALTGQFIMRQARRTTSATGRNFERNSYTAFAIGGAVLISAILMTIQYVLTIVEHAEEDIGGLCDGLRF